MNIYRFTYLSLFSFLWEGLSSTLRKFRLYDTELSTGVSMFYVRSWDPIHLVAECLYTFASFSLSPFLHLPHPLPLYDDFSTVSMS